MRSTSNIMSRAYSLSLILLLFASGSANLLAVDITGVKPNAIGLPELNAILRPSAGVMPYSGLDTVGDTFTNIRLVLDTGASGVVLFETQANALAVPTAEFDAQTVVFSDVGVGGITTFNVSTPLHVSLGHFDAIIPPDYDPLTEALIYPEQFPGIRLQLGPPGSGGFILGQTQISGIVGMPLFYNKTIVIQPKFAENIFLDTIRAYIYTPGIAPAIGPGFLPTNLDIALSLKNFSRFTTITPNGAPGPSVNDNPFIGPDPLAAFEGQTPLSTAPPGVVLEFNGSKTTQSLLLDTGNQVSSISSNVAALFNVRYQADTQGTATPVLESFDPGAPALPGTPLSEQFTLTVQGIGGIETIAGFYLDSLQMKTVQGSATDDTDPNHLNFISAPVYVQDIELTDPITSEKFTLAGIVGMNYLMASFEGLFIGTFNAGPFETIVLNFDQNGTMPNTLGLHIDGFTPIETGQSTHEIPVPVVFNAGFAIILLWLAYLSRARNINTHDRWHPF